MHLQIVIERADEYFGKRGVDGGTCLGLLGWNVDPPVIVKDPKVMAEDQAREIAETQRTGSEQGYAKTIAIKGGAPCSQVGPWRRIIGFAHETNAKRQQFAAVP